MTPFAIITDAETGVKWPIADYELLPNMAIVDVDNMMTQPKGLTSASGIDVMTHAIEAYVSIMRRITQTDLPSRQQKQYLSICREHTTCAMIGAREKMQTHPVWQEWHLQTHFLD